MLRAYLKGLKQTPSISNTARLKWSLICLRDINTYALAPSENQFAGKNEANPTN
jgi:hypothetical protein